MNTKRVQAAEGVILAALKTRKTAAGIAIALESACLLQSPETAAELARLRARVAELETQSPRVRTDDLVPGDRVWHPYEMARFTVNRVAPDGSASGLLFHNRATDENESGLRVTGTDDGGETVHVDCAPSYLWTRESAGAELEQLRARVAELESERHSTNEALSDAAEQLRVQRDRIAELERPAVEAQRAAVRESYRELAAQAREDRDYEGAFNVECDLREREEQWAADDRAAVPRQVEDPHDSPLHHDYAISRDLPEVGRA